MRERSDSSAKKQTYIISIYPFVNQSSKAIKGLSVSLDRLVYLHEPDKYGSERAHVFVYFLTIRNLSQITVTLKGRRWIITYEDERCDIIDGDGIVGKEPTLATGESFSYNSCHISSCNCAAKGSFHGIDSLGHTIHTRIPEFKMNIPLDTIDGPVDLLPS